MDQTERWAEGFLIERFKAEDIRFEPDGNIPPDFLIEGRIAVEVTRLNQHFQAASGETEGVEKLRVARLIRLKKILNSFEPPTRGPSWYVFHEFERPQLTKNWERILRGKLDSFLQGNITDQKCVISIDDHFSLHLIRRAEAGTHPFILGGVSDNNAGGWVRHELERNLGICIANKSQKIAPHRSKYPEWWLVLVDYLIGGTPETMHVEHDFDKVLIIHPRQLCVGV